MKNFEEDYRESNPGLHFLYTKWAVTHLAMMEDAIIKFNNEANINTMDVSSAISKEVKRKIEKKASYYEAKEILNSIRELNIFPKEEE